MQGFGNCKMFVSDIDGTLTSVGSFSVPLSTRRLFNRLKRVGIITVLATGRSPVLAKGDFVGSVEADYIVAGNGAAVVDNNGNPISRNEFTKREMDAVMDFAVRVDACLSFSFSDGYFFYLNYDKFRERHGWNKFCENSYRDGSSRDRHLASMPISALICMKDEDAAKFDLGDKGLVLLQFAPCMYDIVREGVTKRQGIELLLEREGLTWNDVVAAGDSGNDFTMLEAAGVAVAMGNAPQKLKAVCDYNAKSGEKRGLNAVLRAIYKDVKGKGRENG